MKYTRTRYPAIYSYASTRGERRYYVVASGPDGKQRTQSGLRTLDDARAAKEALQARGNAPLRLTLARYLWDQWLPTVDATPSTLRAYRASIKRIERHIGGVHLGKLTPTDIENLKGAGCDGVAGFSPLVSKLSARAPPRLAPPPNVW